MRAMSEEKTSPPPAVETPSVFPPTTSTTSATTDAEKRREADAALREMLAPVRGSLLAGRILGVLAGIATAAPYLALVRLGDVMLAGAADGRLPASQEVRPVVMWLVTAFIVQALLLFAGLMVTHVSDLRLRALLRERMIGRISRAPLSWFSAHSSGRIRKAIQDDTASLHHLVAHAPVENAMAIASPIAMLAASFALDWRLGLLAMVTLPIYLGLQAWSMRGMGDKTAEMDTRLGEVSSRAVELADGIAVIKAFGQVGRAHDRYTQAARAFSRFYLDWVGPMLRASALSEALVSVPVIVLIMMSGGALLVTAGTVTPAAALAATLIALVLPATVLTIGNATWSSQIASSAALRLREVLEAPQLEETGADGRGDERADAGAIGRVGPVGRVEFSDVSYSYGRTLALDGVDLELAPGTVTALVGRSGSGKSTLATTLARFQDPDRGSVRIDGRDVRSMTQRELYSTVSFVLQDPQLLRITLRENIRLARPDADDTAVREAARAACVLDEIEQMPHGLDTVVGEGVSLSGGQAQRVSIARALLADAPVLILDEATAASDPDSEAEIQQALNRLTRGRTVLVIAHRPEAVLGVDQLVRLEGGRVVRRLIGEEVTPSAIRAAMEAPQSTSVPSIQETR
ncbi:ABC transporter ATP-binding protein [Brachybacterium kimchii]|uniref:ABC transporter ATP-binding protein/permease n=1 Tax=Brachybacterium kimchii TaxID=2942909 RepID=A0ABY4N2Z1_9MICO|nr:ABC transporter ATP-binding protein [Brachybacterium kimchii]UQN28509.1 ABC transporter ATP-binding protein/permease [Brachybacterium kimchii]